MRSCARCFALGLLGIVFVLEDTLADRDAGDSDGGAVMVSIKRHDHLDAQTFTSGARPMTSVPRDVPVLDAFHHNFSQNGTQGSSFLEVLRDNENIGKVVKWKTIPGFGFLVNTVRNQVAIRFYGPEIVRVQAAWQGNPRKLATNCEDLVVPSQSEDARAKNWTPIVADKGDHLEFSGSEQAPAVLHVEKETFKMSFYSGGLLRWSESRPLKKLGDQGSIQSIATETDEMFFGGGMQNGVDNHAGRVMSITVKDYNWNEFGKPSAVPFFQSSRGFGIFRCTWAAGEYDFTKRTGEEALLKHAGDPHRTPDSQDGVLAYDAFFFGGRASSPTRPVPRFDVASVLEGYTFITGRPFMPPIYALGLGDSDCYRNARHGWNTEVAGKVAERYRDLDMPVSWMLINDGYGCGYGKDDFTSEDNAKFPKNTSVLNKVSKGLQEDKIVTGLWSSSGLPNFPDEVSKHAVRIAKTDVQWIGMGGLEAFRNVAKVAEDIEKYSDGRRFIWTVEGWAGTHRYAVMWTGDNSGTFDYIRWQVPTFTGCGFSAQAHVSGDIDGIFGGSAETQVRDLQFKSFMTVMMTMSGWAESSPDKQPFAWGEPYSSINRMYLKLKQQLVPYFYSLSRLAHETGLPPVRHLIMEFPDDRRVMDFKQQFLAGPWFLVAPVFKSVDEASVRDGIYLPAGKWIDYWTGRMFVGPAVVNAYPVPLHIMPIFVREGAIVPMRKQTTSPSPAAEGPLIVDIFSPHPETKDEESPTSTEFVLYEDDGVTRRHEQGEYTKTVISCEWDFAAKRGWTNSDVNDTITTDDIDHLFIKTSEGQAGGPPSRELFFHVQGPAVPFEVIFLDLGYDEAKAGERLMANFGPEALAKVNSFSALEEADGAAWFFDRTGPQGESYSQATSLKYFAASGNRDCSEAACPGWYHSKVVIKVPAKRWPKGKQLAVRALIPAANLPAFRQRFILKPNGDGIISAGPVTEANAKRRASSQLPEVVTDATNPASRARHFLVVVVLAAAFACGALANTMFAKGSAFFRSCRSRRSLETSNGQGDTGLAPAAAGTVFDRFADCGEA